MFTGIVEEIGIVRETSPSHLAFEAHRILEGTKIGDSVAVNGVCLTVNSLSGYSLGVDVMPETLRCTNLGGLHYSDQVNLERALVVGGRLGGHLVSGHVEDTGEVVKVNIEGTARIMKIWVQAKLMPYMVDKGFIAIDGVSLTIVVLDDFSIAVSLVDYTLEHTILGNRKPGDIVNLETDIMAKYVERIEKRKNKGLTFDFLKEYGFVEGL